MRGLIAGFAVVAMFGCGGDDALSAEAEVKEWGDAINARDWERACEISARPAPDCEDKLRGDYAQTRLRFDGTAINGGGLKPGEQYFSFGSKQGNIETVFVTAVRSDDTFGVRVEATIVR